MDVFQPTGKANGAAVLWVISESWMSDSRMIDPRLFTDLVGRGYTVFAVVHSSVPAFPLDEIVPDIHRAVRYVRHHAKSYKVDPDRMAIVGTSAGGHLAALVGVGDGEGPPFPTPDFTRVGRYDPVERESSKVAAFVSFCGPTDFVNFEAEGKSILDARLPEEVRKKLKIDRITAPFEFRDYDRKAYQFSRVTNEKQIQRRLKELSPVALVSAKSAPGLLIYGEKDTHVPIRQAERLAERLKAAGVRVDLVIRKGVGHGVYQPGDSKFVADWLDKRLHLGK